MYGKSVHIFGGKRRGAMEISNFKHKALRRLYEEDKAKGLPPAAVDKLRKLLLAMDTADDLNELEKFPGWRLHPLKGDRRGFWSLTVTGNWRLIFRYDGVDNRASDIDFIDYHGS